MLNHIEHNRLSRSTATTSQTRPVCNKGITQFLPATHTRTIVSVLSSRKATALWPIPSYTAWWQRHIGVSLEFLRRAARPRLEPATSCGHLSCIWSAVVRESSTKHISLPGGCSSIRTCEFMSVLTTRTISLFQTMSFFQWCSWLYAHCLHVLNMVIVSGQHGRSRYRLWPLWSLPVIIFPWFLFSSEIINRQVSLNTTLLKYMLVTSKLIGFSFVWHFTPIMCCFQPLASSQIYARALLEYVIIIMWLHSVIKKLRSMKFAEDKVLTFLILHEKC